MTRSWDQSQAERHRQLADLWQRAESLNEPELGQLCSLVIAILLGCSRTNLATTNQEFEDLIHSYIAEKVLLPLQNDPAKFRQQMPTSHGALIQFFQRFVISITRKPESRLAHRSDTIETESGEVRAEAEARSCPAGQLDQLHTLGFSVTALHEQATRFVGRLSSVERAVLRNYCDTDLSVARLFPGSPQQQALARVAVVQMGLWHSRTPGRDIGKFSHTRLGRFMTEAIGQPLDETHLEAVEALMSMLCDVACDETV